MAGFITNMSGGLNGNGIQFGTLSQIASSGFSGPPLLIGGLVAAFNFNDTGSLTLLGTGLSFTPPSTLSGTVTELSYMKSGLVFSITGMGTPLATLAGLIIGGGDELAMLGAIFSGDDTITGSTLADRLIGFDGADTINGGDGNDTLRGGAGADALNGGAGLDFANYQGSSAEVFVDLQNNLVFSGDAAGDTLNGIENLYGSSHDDTLSGDAGRNIIGGEAGADLIDGRGGDDALSGEAGNDILNGRDGNDRLVGGDGTDTLGGDAGTDSLDGGAGNDSAFGGAGNDSVTGGAGTDQLDGGDDNDIVEGGAGADQLVGGSGIDTASYAGAAAGVTVVLGGASTGGDAAGDTLIGIEQVMGSGFADSITGDAGANTLWGLAGDDVLTGGGGADVLKGGAGNDTFRCLAIADSTVAASGKDTIVDFTTGDRIDLSAIDATSDLPDDAAFTFGTGNFTAAGQIRVVDFGGTRYGVYLETTGDKVPDAIITVYSDHVLTAADFVL
ncbi:calcium-binding protein [Inquilinus sp.]|jgi:Ca2+-binding RTX toxin-like protein|uniref:calcium-binding protein n=1 Tax=Inquilinus sp. TaxID=1932117 RepID=UPI0037837996